MSGDFSMLARGAVFGALAVASPFLEGPRASAS